MLKQAKKTITKKEYDKLFQQIKDLKKIYKTITANDEEIKNAIMDGFNLI